MAPVTPDAEALHRAAAGIAVAVGTLACASPRALLAVFGVPAREVNGIAAFGWRLFGVRTVAVGGAALAGDARARAAILPVQVADQVVFAHAYRTRAVPRTAAVGAMLTSGVLIGLDLLARAARR